MIIPAALDVELRECTVTLLQVDASGEATPLLDALEPAVEAGMSAAGLIHACERFLILTSADQLFIIFRV